VVVRAFKLSIGWRQIVPPDQKKPLNGILFVVVVVVTLVLLALLLNHLGVAWQQRR
jgi:hypothetical protein